MSSIKKHSIKDIQSLKVKRLNAGDLLGRYEILSLLGRGGNGIVYLARDVNLGKKWAVKQVLKAEVSSHKQVTNEVFFMMELDHHGIPRVTDQMEDEDYYYIVMDYCKGESLWDYCKKHPVTIEDLLDWGIQLCDILGYLHSRKPAVIFRDMKPGNVICDENKRLKLIDFGIARTDKDVQDAKGTKGFAAPEQYKGVSSVQSDIYNLGATLFWCMKKQKYHPLKKILKRAMEEHPQKRYKNCEEMRKKFVSLQKKLRWRKLKQAVALSFGCFLGSVCMTFCIRIFQKSAEERNLFQESISILDKYIEMDIQEQQMMYKLSLERKKEILNMHLQELEKVNNVENKELEDR